MVRQVKLHRKVRSLFCLTKSSLLLSSSSESRVYTQLSLFCNFRLISASGSLNAFSILAIASVMNSTKADRCSESYIVPGISHLIRDARLSSSRCLCHLHHEEPAKKPLNIETSAPALAASRRTELEQPGSARNSILQGQELVDSRLGILLTRFQLGTGEVSMIG